MVSNAQDKAVSMVPTVTDFYVAWPTDPPAFRLEVTTNLADMTSWRVQTGDRIEEGGEFRVAVPSVHPHEFFRLQLDTNAPLEQPAYVRVSSPPKVVMQTHPLFLFVKADGTLPITYQWFREGELLEGETNRVLIRSFAQFEDAGMYYAVVMNGNGTNFSDEIPVEVIPDDVPPALVNAFAMPNFREVIVEFSERVNPAMAGVPNNYQILSEGSGPVLVENATMNPGGMSVTLRLAPSTPLQPLSEYVLFVNGVADLATPPNFIAPGSAVTFTTGAPPPDA
jgi:hypothetical protein